MSARFIALVGENGSGKGTFVKELKDIFPERRVEHLPFSSPIGETLELWDIPKTRENYQDLIVMLEERFGRTLLSDVIYKRALACADEGADYVVLDGVRWPADFEMIAERLPECKLIYITASQRVRFYRLKKRKQKAGEEFLTRDQFLKEEARKNEIYIPEIGAKADWKLENSGGVTAFREQVRYCVSCLKLAY